MFYINDETFSRLLKSGEKIETRDAWGLQKRLNQHASLQRWDSGERIGVSSGQWEEQARLIDAGGNFLFLELQEVYWGQCFGDKPPTHYRIPRALYETALVSEGVES